MLVKDAMTHGVDFVQRTDTVQEAAQKMGTDNVGALPVFDGNYAVGMITDRDITVRCVNKGLNPSKIKVSELMTRDVFFCRADMSLEEAAQIMEDHQVRRLLVRGADDHVIGVVSLADLARSADNDLAARVLRKISTPAHPDR